MEGTLVVKLDREYVLNYEDELKIAEETINPNLSEQAARYCFYAMLEELAEEQMGQAKMTLEIIEAETDKLVREKLTQAGTKFTEAVILNEVKTDPTRLKALGEFNQARATVGKLHAIREAFIHRKDMLVTLASNMRAQMDTNLTVKMPR